MQRKALLVLLGFILGIFWGLYFFSVTLIFVLVLSIALFINLYLKKTKRVFKLFFKKEAVILFCISLVFFGLYFVYRNYKYEDTYNTFISSKNVVLEVISSKEEKEYTVCYKARLQQIDSNKIQGYYTVNIYIKKQANIKELQYGDIIKVAGEVNGLEEARNFRWF